MTDHTTQPEPSLRLNKLVQASPQKVYDTWLDASLYPKWFAPDPGTRCTSATIDARVGGKYRIEIDTPQRLFVGFGEYIELVPGKRLVFTWSWEGEPGFGENSRITIELFEAENPHGDGPATEIVFTHAGLNTAAERSEHTGGWWGCLRALGFFVRGVDPVEAMYGTPTQTSN